MSPVKERPILFSGPMVRAILDGSKTMTRRIVKPQPPSKDWLINTMRTDVGLWNDHGKWRMCGAVGVCREAMGNQWPKSHEWKCPYGAVGDRLWVRETWQANIATDGHVVYQATDPDWAVMEGWRWRPSIHMPREASRFALEITGIRVERLNDISHHDALQEGLIEWSDPPRVQTLHYGLTRADVWETSAPSAFKRLWEDINGAGSWSANPLVWVIEFKRLPS